MASTMTTITGQQPPSVPLVPLTNPPVAPPATAINVNHSAAAQQGNSLPSTSTQAPSSAVAARPAPHPYPAPYPIAITATTSIPASLSTICASSTPSHRSRFIPTFRTICGVILGIATLAVAVYTVMLQRWSAWNDFRDSCWEDKERGVFTAKCNLTLSTARPPPVMRRSERYTTYDDTLSRFLNENAIYKDDTSWSRAFWMPVTISLPVGPVLTVLVIVASVYYVKPHRPVFKPIVSPVRSGFAGNGGAGEVTWTLIQDSERQPTVQETYERIHGEAVRQPSPSPAIGSVRYVIRKHSFESRLHILKNHPEGCLNGNRAATSEAQSSDPGQDPYNESTKSNDYSSDKPVGASNGTSITPCNDRVGGVCECVDGPMVSPVIVEDFEANDVSEGVDDAKGDDIAYLRAVTRLLASYKPRDK